MCLLVAERCDARVVHHHFRTGGHDDVLAGHGDDGSRRRRDAVDLDRHLAGMFGKQGVDGDAFICPSAAGVDPDP